MSITSRRFRVTLSSVLIAIALIVTVTLPVGAVATSNSGTSGNGMRVSPVVTNLIINAGQTQIVPIYVQNVTSAPLKLQVIINDFVAGNNENGQPQLLLNANQSNPTHGLKKFITPISDITLQPNVQKTVNVDIVIPAGTAGGGYYGAVRFAPVTSGGNTNVSLTASVASLILVKVPGNIKDDLQLSSFSVKQDGNGSSQAFFSGNKNLIVTAKFQNFGNVQEQPFGKILLEQGGKELASYAINNTTPAGNVLPSSIRQFNVNLGNKVGTIGKYTVLGNFGYGSSGQLISGSTTFYVVPVLLIIVIIIVILIILFFIFVFPRLMSQYNRRVIRRASPRR
ncbi:MAG: WxL protein peptidoglycan domain-containing protein [Candidatus Saccharimonadales bacterium]